MRALLLLLLLVAPAGAQSLTVYAAASLSTALQELAPLIPDLQLRLSFASSSSLAKQIEAGAPADLYFSASAQWMDYLQERDLIEAHTRVDLLGNRLVLVAPRGEGFAVRLHRDFPFAAAFSGRLALGDPEHVPAGMYARQALLALGWWAAIAERLAPSPDVRAALVLVERGECPAGIVYATDAAISRRVEILATLPDSLHAPIAYPVALVQGRATPQARRFLAFLRSGAAASVFRKHGFTTLADKENERAQP